MILVEAVTMAEIRKIPGLEGMELLQCDIRADSIQHMSILYGPNFLELGIEHYSEHTVWRYVHLRGKIGGPQGNEDIKALYRVSAGCAIFSISQGWRYWQPYTLQLSVGPLMPGPGDGYASHVYWNGMNDDVPIRKNADNPCADLCALQSIAGIVTYEEGDKP